VIDMPYDKLVKVLVNDIQRSIVVQKKI